MNTWVWVSPLTDDNVATLLRTVADLGFDAVEIPLENVGDLSAETVGAALADTGLTPYVVGAMAPGRDLVSTDPASVARTRDYLRACIDLAASIGARSVCGPFYAATGRVWRMDAEQRTAAYAEMREGLAPVVDHAGERGVTIGIEPLNRYETSLVNTVDQALEAYDGMLGESLGLALDTYHLNIEERSTADAVRRAGEPSRAPSGLRQRPWSAGWRPDRLAGPDRRPRRGRLRRATEHRKLHCSERLHRDGGLDLATAGRQPGRPGPRRTRVPALADGR